MKPTLVILAAGMGSRYGSLKQVDPVGPSGETIMDYSVYDAIRAGFGKIVFVIRKDIENDFRDNFTYKLEGRIPFEFAYQELDMLPSGITVPEGRTKPWGTGHAVMVASHCINEPFAVINADDFYGNEAYDKLSRFLTNNPGGEFAMVAYDLVNTLSDFGDVSRGVCELDHESYLESVTERTRIRKTHGNIAFQDTDDSLVFLEGNAAVSMNFWGFTPEFFTQLETLFQEFINENSQNLKSEFYLSSAIDLLIKSNKAKVKVLRTSSQWFGVTYKEDKPTVMAKIKNLVKLGIYPQSLWK